MRHRVCFAVALATALTVTAFAGPAVAATPTGTAPAGKLSFPGPGASAKEKKLAYSRYCGAEGKHRNTRKAKNRRTCLGAMARLAVGKPSSPNAACRTLKRKRSKGRKASTGLLDGLPDLDDEPVEEPDDESNEDSEEF